MDTKKLIKEAKARFKHQESKIYLQEKYNSKLTVATQGGMWDITIELLSFLKSCDGEVIILDSFQRPIKVNADRLRTELNSVYNQVMEEWLLELTELQKNR